VIDLPWQENDPRHLERAREAIGRLMLAGGLAADNVRAAIDAVRPWAVDASSRLEVKPGVKDPERVRSYVEAAQCP
jgi:phosphoribosylanthranilate isomerase